MTACAVTETGLDTDEAYLVVEPYYLAVQEQFLEAGFERTKRARLYCAPSMHDTPRHFAACRDDGLAILFAPELAELDERMVLAILAHELGHAADFLYPGQYALGPDRIAVERDRDAFTPKTWARWMRSWEERDTDTVEYTADALAALATGHRIGYTGPCLLQTFDRGRARPQGLR
jgi:hypothetical protein